MIGQVNSWNSIHQFLINLALVLATQIHTHTLELLNCKKTIKN